MGFMTNHLVAISIKSGEMENNNISDANCALLSKDLDVLTKKYEELHQESSSKVSDDSCASLTKDLDILTKKYEELHQETSSSNKDVTPVSAVVAVDNGPIFLDSLKKSGSDKLYRHHYENYYIPWLKPFRDIPKYRMLEIGADAGKSLLLWSDYFTNPELILGLAYGSAASGIDDMVAENRETGKIHEVVQVVKGDQSKEETMEMLRKMGPFHIIIDDGSHAPDHMAFSMFSLWNSVEPGGLYILEDLECNYWRKGTQAYGYPLDHTGFGVSPDI